MGTRMAPAPRSLRAQPSRIQLLGKTFPAWVVALVAVLSTAGAATGIVLAGQTTGNIGASVSQSLMVLNSPATSISGNADAGLVTVRDDGTGFEAAAEINQGDQFDVNMALENASGAELVGELTLIAPDGITLHVKKDGDIVDDVVRTGPFTWKFKVPSPTDTVTADLRIIVALADDAPPGFYQIEGKLKQVAV